MAGIGLNPSLCCGCSGCQLCVTVTDCAGAPVAGATVTIKDSGGATVATGTTDAAGSYCYAAITPGTYSVAASKSGSNGSNKSVTVTCPGTTAVALTVGSAGGNFNFQPFFLSTSGGDHLLLASLQINGGTYTPNGFGFILGSLPPGTYPYTLSAPRYDSITGSITISGGCSGFGGSFAMFPSAGYSIATQPIIGYPAGWDYHIPIANTLFMSDAKTGVNQAMAASGVSGSYATNGWCGAAACAAGAFDAHFSAAAACTCAAAGSVGINYNLFPARGMGVSLTASSASCAGNNPPFGGAIGRSLTLTSFTQTPIFTATYTYPGTCEQPYVTGDTLTVTE
jgi:Carboxypeptidase regulatory-like domain